MFRIKYILICALSFLSFFVIANESIEEIYWNTPEYRSRLLEKTSSKVQCVYHARKNNFSGNWIVPLNLMPYMEGFNEIYKHEVAKYIGREHLLTREIPTLNCLWNDVIFLSPLHPHKHYEEYKKIGFTPKSIQFYKIPVEVLREKSVTVWNWFSYKKYPHGDPLRHSIEAYCDFDFFHYQEMDDLPEDTKEFYRTSFDPSKPAKFPIYNWYRIPHILCQDPIDILDDRITIINWEDPEE